MGCDVLFWNVDTQNDFMCDGSQSYDDYVGKLLVPDAQAIVRNLDEITYLAASNNKRVVNTRDWHMSDSPELSDEPNFIDTFPPHCLQGTYGAEFIPATSPTSGLTFSWDEEHVEDSQFDLLTRRNVDRHSRNIILNKDQFDVFRGNPHASRVVEALDPQIAIVYGVATNVCVDFAVRGLLDRGISVWVISDAIKALPDIPSPIKAWQEAGVLMVLTKELKALASLV